MSRVLLTGAGGFIGGPALLRLREAGHEVHAVSSRSPQDGRNGVRWHHADLLDPAAARAVLTAAAPELLLHLAWYAEHGLFWTSPENVRWVEATLSLMRAFAGAGGRRAVLAGTCAEYEWTPEGGVLAEDAPLRPATLYGVAKNATREVAQVLAAEAGVELAWGRIFFPYGPGEAQARLVPSVAGALLAGNTAAVSDGRQLRDFVFVDDVAAAFVALLDSDVSGAVNIGSGEGVAVHEVVSLIGDAVGRPDLIRFGAVPRRPGEPALLVADVGRLRDEVGFSGRVPLREGIAKTVAWWQAQSPAALDRASAQR